MRKLGENDFTVSKNMNKVVKLLRIINEISVSDLAEKMALSQSYISSIEAGNRRITDDILKKYSKCFRIPEKTLRFFDETTNSQKLKTQEILILILSKIYKGDKLECDFNLKSDK